VCARLRPAGTSLPQAIARALGFGGRLDNDRVVLGGMDALKERLSRIRHLVITGCGTSMYAGMYGAKLMRQLHAFGAVPQPFLEQDAACLWNRMLPAPALSAQHGVCSCCLLSGRGGVHADTVQVFDAAEVKASSLPPPDGGGMVAISQSGETRDVFKAVIKAEEAGITSFSVVNAVGSLIARTTKLGVYLNAGRENAVASTKAFSSQVTALALVTLWFRQQRDDACAAEGKAGRDCGLPDRYHLLEAVQRLPISFGMALRTRDMCRDIAAKLLDKQQLFILGKGYGEPIAYEGALKIKEITYLNAQGYSGGALKHGPFALIEGRDGPHGSTPIIMIILDDEDAADMLTAAHQVKARGADVYVITDNRLLVREITDSPITIPNNGPLTGLIAVLPLQLIAYELSVMKGIDPDTPRNLAKAVTTD
jgi:glucosamine--fructose-6-phosphate aminotransferase (isomerizing)